MPNRNPPPGNDPVVVTPGVAYADAVDGIIRESPDKQATGAPS